MNSYYEPTSPPSIKASKTFDLGSDSDLTEDNGDQRMEFGEESYISPAPPVIQLASEPPSNIFKHAPNRNVAFYEDMSGAPLVPDYDLLTDEEDMDLEFIEGSGIMILPRYAVWNPMATTLALPSLYASSGDEEEGVREGAEVEESEEEHSSDCSTVASLPSLQKMQQERAARRAAVGTKALKGNPDHDPLKQHLRLGPNAKATNFGALAA